MAIDYDSFIAETYYNILARRAEGIIPYGVLDHQDQLIEKGFVPTFDTIKAKDIFKEADWRGNITLYDLGTLKGFRRNLDLLVKSAIASMDIGINVKVESINVSVWDSEYISFHFN